MKFKFAFVFLTFVCWGNVFGQANNWVWAKSAQGGAEGSDMAADKFGNVFVSGNLIGSSITFSPYTLNNPTSSWIACLAKYDSTGNVRWARNASGLSWVRDVATDNSGNVYMIGNFDTSSISFGGNITISEAGTEDGYIVKYDSTGNVLWARNIGGAGSWVDAYGLTIDNSGNIYLAGRFDSPTISFGTHSINRLNGYTIFLAKYDSAGNDLWAQSVVGGQCEVNHIANDPEGNVYMAGDFNMPTIIFGTTTLTNAGSIDGYIAKFDTLGNSVWAKNFGGNANDNITSVGADNYGHIYMSGFFYSPALSIGSNAFTNAGCSDIFLSKLDTSGNVVWAKSVGGIGNEQTGTCGLSVAANGNIFLSGSFGDYFCGWDTVSFGQFTMIAASWDPMFVAEYNPGGVVNCAASLVSGGNDVDFPNAITADNFGHAYTGADFGQDGMMVGSTTLHCIGENLFVAKYSCNEFADAVDAFNNEKNISIFPNPSSGNFTIKNNFSGNYQIEIFNSLGQKIFRKEKLNQNDFEFDLGDHPDGIYFVRIISDGKIYSQKIIKE